jgi:thiamine kinase-like enzyme
MRNSGGAHWGKNIYRRRQQAVEETLVVDGSISLILISRVIKMISGIPFFTDKNARINKIETLPGGLTNYNFKVTVDHIPYALRVAGDGTSEYLDRPAEKHNASMMAEMGINAGIIYYNETTGDQVCIFIDKTLHIADFQESENLKQAARIFHKYHTCGQEFLSLFDPIKVTDGYNDLLKEKNAELFEGYDRLTAKLDEIKQLFADHPQKLVPSHNDPLPENFLVNEQGMFLIDWEYSGMNDPMFDLGDFSVENNLTKEEEGVFLCEYFGGQVTKKQYGLTIMHKFLCDVLWSVWALLQIATGKPREEYWPYGLNRFNRCMALMNEPDFDSYIQAIREDSSEVVFRS